MNILFVCKISAQHTRKTSWLKLSEYLLKYSNHAKNYITASKGMSV